MEATAISTETCTEQLSYINPSDIDIEIAVIGGGPVGMAFAETIYANNPQAKITVFGDEPVAPYNRVQLSALLAGEIDRAAIDWPLPSAQDAPNFLYHAAAISKIIAKEKYIVDCYQNRHHYDTLVIASGARAHIPNILGKDKNGVYRFRSLLDTESLIARLGSSRHVVVLGGGLLGLEAAKGLRRAGTQVTVIQQGSHLMNRQLDVPASTRLEKTVHQLGIDIITQSGVRQILGDAHVNGVKTHDGKFISCDTVLICAGIKPNMELARDAGIHVRKGIIVDDQLRSSDPDIFAIGECCEHDGVTYGLVNPGFDQAKIAANVINGGDAIYKGSLSISRLKVIGEAVTSMGDINTDGRHALRTEVHFENDESYRKIITLRGRIIGAVGIGDWPEAARVQSAFQQRQLIYPWQRIQFKYHGRLWFESDSDNISQWASHTEVCQCKSVTKGELVSAINEGAKDLNDLKRCTNAGTVCGSCVPLMDELLADKSGRKRAVIRETAWQFIGLLCLSATLAIGLTMFMPEATISNSVQTQGWFEKIWNDKFYKQVSGFSLIGMTAIGLIMSIRKRWSYTWMGQFTYWRLLHISLGVVTAITLILHTGFHLGNNLNLLLMLNFLAIVFLGITAAAIITISHRLPARQAKRLRKGFNKFHIVISWPLPALLAMHILSVYYF